MMSDGATEMKREEFKVGDRVRCLDDGAVFYNQTGLVEIADDDDTCLVKFSSGKRSWFLFGELEKLDDDWNEERQDIVGQNGNDGSHYEVTWTDPFETVNSGNHGVSIDDATPQEWDALKTPVSQPIADACDKIKTLLLEKNRKYGNSALSPKRIFSKSCATEQLKVRIDDKLSRIANTGLDGADEDTLQDLIGYLILLMVARDA